jgi:hypothetical protein
MERRRRERAIPRSQGSALGALVVTAVLTGACTTSGAGASGTARSATPSDAIETIPQPDVSDLPVAPESARVDLAMPTFSNPTEITNPLFPIANGSNLLLGKVDGMPFRSEVTLLPDTRIMEWNGARIETAVSQYVAYLDGRLHEVALDLYAQADDGSVWYLGEDVFNYEDGVVVDTEGTWFAGIDGPAAMIMPGDPQVGDVYRPENIPNVVFEEVTVRSVHETVDGPTGPVQGAIEVEELHMDGATEAKTFAPGYGEFYTSGGGDTEALALAVPTDAVSGSMPAQLTVMSAEAKRAFLGARSEAWVKARSSVGKLRSAWKAYGAADVVPPRVGARMEEAIDTLGKAYVSHEQVVGAQAALDVGQSILDLQLRYRTPTDIDLARLELWARQLVLDMGSGDAAATMGDLTTIDWIRARFAHTVSSPDLSRVDLALGEMRLAAVGGRLATTTRSLTRLGKWIAGIELAS